MNCSESKLSCQAGDGANSLVEGYSKVDLNGTMVSALLCLWCLAQDPPFPNK